jgi:hypothetical protein
MPPISHFHVFPHGPLGRDQGSEAAAEQAAARAESVDQRLDRALLTVQAMWSLLRDSLQLTDEQLVERIVEVDESDGFLDGRVRRPAKNCTHCKRAIPGRSPRCLYCGEAVIPDPFA